jgi:hypothetical protein
MIAERLAAATVGIQKYYSILQQSYENEKALRELNVSGIENALLEISNKQADWKQATLNVYNDLTSSLSSTMQNFFKGNIKSWSDFGKAVDGVWNSLKDSVIKSIRYYSSRNRGVHDEKSIGGCRNNKFSDGSWSGRCGERHKSVYKKDTGLLIFAGRSSVGGKISRSV